MTDDRLAEKGARSQAGVRSTSNELRGKKRTHRPPCDAIWFFLHPPDKEDAGLQLVIDECYEYALAAVDPCASD